MKTKTIEVCDARFLDVACKNNDSVDIRCGGPAILGYDFYISSDENAVEIIQFIKKCLKTYDRPLLGITTGIKKDFPVENLWTKQKIEECIKTHAVE